MSASRRAAALACAVLLAACGSNTTSPAPVPSGTPGAPAPTAAATAAPTAAAGLTLPWDTGKVAAHAVECAYGQEGILGTPPATTAGVSGPCGNHHNGPPGSSQDAFALDLDLGAGGSAETVAAVAAGTVRWAQAYPATSSWACYGTSVAVDSPLPGGAVLTAMYAHLASASVIAGQAVAAGAALGTAGNTGSGIAWQSPTNAADKGTCATMGVHLHLALYTSASYLLDTAGAAVSPPYGGSATEPTPWLNCARTSTLGTPPAGETGACTGLHAGDELTYTGPGAAPAPTAAPAVSAAWTSPKDGAKLKTASLALSATVSPASPSTPVAKVAFTVSWGSTVKTACTVAKADAKGAWSCKADLWKLGAPLGKLTLSFDVTDSTGAVTKAPVGARTVTFAAPPPAPTGLRLHEDKVYICGMSPCLPATIGWTRLADQTSRVQVFAVMADPAADSGSVVTCSGALAKLKGWLSTHAPSTLNGDINVPYWYNLFEGSSGRGQTSIAVVVGGWSDYRGEYCAYYVRAVNAYGASQLVPAGSDSRVNQ